MNIFQTWVYLGSGFYVLMRWKKSRIEELFLGIMVIGAFIFQLFWEANSRYVMFFFFLLIPYAVYGYQLLFHWLEETFKMICEKGWGGYRRKAVIIGSALVVLAVSFLCFKNYIVQSKIYRYTIGVQDSSEILDEYEQIKGKY